MNPLIRNLAIIAHVDHGKTTLVDALLRQTHVFRENQTMGERVMDRNDLERERGITIFAKNASIFYQGVKINLIDTPGHADFGGEVERVLCMADGVLLLVDACEGVKPQTRYVLKKALQNHLKPIVVINKIDREEARPKEVVEEVLALFLELVPDHSLDFPILYASARDGFAQVHLETASRDLEPLLETILKYIPPPYDNQSEPFKMLISHLDYSDYMGQLAIGRVFAGSLHPKEKIVLLRTDGRGSTQRMEEASITKLSTFIHLQPVEAEEVQAGDIAVVAGFQNVQIGDTLSTPNDGIPLTKIQMDEPTMVMLFIVNDSPFKGRDGHYLSSRHIRERLYKEKRTNVALRIEETPNPAQVKVYGRGLLHLSILIENMRREGYEVQISKPEVLMKREGEKLLEPFENTSVDVPEAYGGKVLELLGARRAKLLGMDKIRSQVHYDFSVPTRGLIGLRNKLLMMTRGEGVLYHSFSHYETFQGSMPRRATGTLVAMEEGLATAYALDSLRDRGMFFIPPGDRVYAGMIVGEHVKDNDIIVNVCRKKHLSNVRSTPSNEAAIAPPHRTLSLEDALEYIEEDELVEVTPQTIRLRKKLLNEKERKRIQRQAETAL